MPTTVKPPVRSRIQTFSGPIALFGAAALLLSGCGKLLALAISAGQKPKIKTTSKPSGKKLPGQKSAMVKATKKTTAVPVKGPRVGRNKLVSLANPRSMPVTVIPATPPTPQLRVVNTKMYSALKAGGALAPFVTKRVVSGAAVKCVSLSPTFVDTKGFSGTGASKRVITLCDPGEVYDLDCRTFTDTATPAYVADSNGDPAAASLACTEPSIDTGLDPAIVAQDALAASTGIPCSEAQAESGEAFCVGDTVVYCNGGELRELSCSDMGLACGAYVDDAQKDTVSCVTPVTTTLSSAIDVTYAFDSDLDCGPANEGKAVCDLTYLTFCNNGVIKALDCSNYESSDGKNATCGLDPSNAQVVTCVFPPGNGEGSGAM